MFDSVVSLSKTSPAHSAIDSRSNFWSVCLEYEIVVPPCTHLNKMTSKKRIRVYTRTEALDAASYVIYLNLMY